MYTNHEDFVRRTSETTQGVFAEDWDPSLVMEFRNCQCNTTLVCLVQTRRDISDAATIRREQFDEVINELAAQGVPEEMARKDIRKIIEYVTTFIEQVTNLISNLKKNN